MTAVAAILARLLRMLFTKITLSHSRLRAANTDVGGTECDGNQSRSRSRSREKATTFMEARARVSPVVEGWLDGALIREKWSLGRDFIRLFGPSASSRQMANVCLFGFERLTTLNPKKVLCPKEKQIIETK